MLFCVYSTKPAKSYLMHFIDKKNSSLFYVSNLNTMTSLWQIISVNQDHADTYKCFATNEFGEAACTANLNVRGGKWTSSHNRFKTYDCLLIFFVYLYCFPSTADLKKRPTGTKTSLSLNLCNMRHLFYLYNNFVQLVIKNLHYRFYTINGFFDYLSFTGRWSGDSGFQINA